MRFAVIRGQLRFPDGSLAPMGIPVYLSYREGGMVQQTQTDNAGKFSFQQLAPGIYRVQIRAPGYRDIESGDLDVNLNPMHYLTYDLLADPNYVGSKPAAGILMADPIPTNAREFFEGGQAALEKGDYAKSIDRLKKAVKGYPKYADAYLLMGLAYRAQHDLNEAGNAFHKCIEMNPNSAAAYAGLGEVHNQKQDYAEAAKALQKAVALNPELAQAQVELGRSYWALGRWQDAEPHVTKALTLSPNDASAHLIMGNIDLRKRDGPAALQQFREYLKLEPEGPMAPAARDMIGKLEKALAQQSQ